MSLRGERGWTLIELLVAMGIAASLVTGLGATLVSGLGASRFGSRQSESLDGARLTMNQVQRDLQGSKQFQNCTAAGQPPGSCVMLVVQPPSGPDQTIRYRLAGSNLYRETDDGTGTFPSSRVVSDRLANSTKTPQQPLFVCSSSGSLLQVTVNMIVQPNPANAPTYRLQTVVRPRNSYYPPSC